MSRRIGAKERIRQFLRPRVGQVVTGHDLQAAVGPEVTEWARRVRELRNEEGWQIVSHNDDASLKPGEYKLLSDPPIAEQYRFSRPISARLRAQVLSRNGNTCQMCGAAAGDSDENNPGRKVRLHIGHIIDRSHGGEETLSNLKALCSTCNQGAKNTAQEPPNWIWLLTQIRRARVDDQRAALDWLKTKFNEGV